jgi:hypothetical protein
MKRSGLYWRLARSIWIYSTSFRRCAARLISKAAWTLRLLGEYGYANKKLEVLEIFGATALHATTSQHSGVTVE